MTREPDDLYPPDVEVVTNDMKATRGRAFVGTALVTFGSGLMLERTLNNDVDYFWLAIGLGLLAAWLQVPRFPWFAVGSIMTGFAVGGFIQSLISAPFESTIGFLFAAAGFFAVYARYPRVAKWAIIPAAIFALFAVGATGVELIGLVPSGITTVMLPLLLIAGGALLLFRNSLPRGVVKCGLIALAITFVGSAASTVDKWESNHDFNGLNFGGERRHATLPPIEGRTVVIDCAAGDLTVREGDDSSVSAEVPGPRRELFIEESETEVIVTTESSGPPILRRVGLFDCDLVLPRGTSIEAATGAGEIDAVYGGGRASYRSGSGEVNIHVLRVGEGNLDVFTGSGDVEIDLDGYELDPTFDLRTGSGEVEVDNNDHGEQYVNAGSALRIAAQTGSGDVTVENE